MKDNCGIVLEGGAMRSIFTAGVLDLLLDKEVAFPNVLAISAGAYAGMNYVSNQRGRCLESLVLPMKDRKIAGIRNFLHKGTFFDMDYLFEEVLNDERYRFDFDRFKAFPGKFITSAVDVDTAENVFFDKFDTKQDFFDIMRAANSMPILAKIVKVDGRNMLDGGMAEAIPIKKALEEGWRKIVVVLTRDTQYRKIEGKTTYTKIIDLLYHKYPQFVELVLHRAERYNESIELVNKLENEGRAFVLRPTHNNMKNGETDVNTLKGYYNEGYAVANEKYKAMMDFLAN